MDVIPRVALAVTPFALGVAAKTRTTDRLRMARGAAEILVDQLAPRRDARSAFRKSPVFELIVIRGQAGKLGAAAEREPAPRNSEGGKGTDEEQEAVFHDADASTALDVLPKKEEQPASTCRRMK